MPVQKKKTVQKASDQPRNIDWGRYGARSESDAEEITWRAKQVGDCVTGTLIEVKEVNTRYGEKVLVTLGDVEVMTSDGEALEVDGQTATVWPTPGLIDEFKRVEADAGQVLVVELAELVDTGKGNPFKRFEIEVRS